MKIKQQVVDKLIAEQLKIAGFPQKDSTFFWVIDDRGDYLVDANSLKKHKKDDSKVFAAPNVAELGFYLPTVLQFQNKGLFLEHIPELNPLVVGKPHYTTAYVEQYDEKMKEAPLSKVFVGETEAEARGKALVWGLQTSTIRFN